MNFDFGKLIVDGENYGSITAIYTPSGQIDYIETFPTNRLGKQRLTIGEVEFLGDDVEIRINVPSNQRSR